MNCAHRFIISGVNLNIVLHMKRDYIPESSMPRREFLYFWNYEFMAICRPKYNMRRYYLLRWNYDNNLGRKVSGVIYRIRRLLVIN